MRYISVFIGAWFGRLSTVLKVSHSKHSSGYSCKQKMSDPAKTEQNVQDGQLAIKPDQDPPPPYASPISTISGAVYVGQGGVSFPQSGQQHPTQPPYPGATGQQPVQNQVQTVYIQSLPAVPYDYSTYNGKYSTIFGITNIVLTTACIVLNGLAFSAQLDRYYDWFGNIGFLICPAAFCGFFIYLASAFSIASGRHKIRCLIITHLVLAIIASVFAFIFLAFSIAALSLEAVDWRASQAGYNDKISFGISIVWLPMAVTMFILTIWCCVLCCQVLCCGRSRSTAPVAVVDGNRAIPSGAVLYINTNY